MAFRRAIELRPQNPDYAAYLAETLLLVGGEAPTAEAETLLRRTLQLEPGNPQARYYLATLRDMRGDHAGAIEDFQFFISKANKEGYADLVSVRQGWIAALRAGQDPFDDATLEAMRGDEDTEFPSAGDAAHAVSAVSPATEVALATSTAAPGEPRPGSVATPGVKPE